MDGYIDCATRKPESPAITAESTPNHVDLYEKWQRSNRLFVMFKTKISVRTRGSVEQYDKALLLLKSNGCALCHVR